MAFRSFGFFSLSATTTSMDSLLLILFLFLHSFSPAAATAADFARDASALISFRSAVGRSVLPWNTSISPCQWKGVVCSGDRVTSLRLPGSGLIGRIPTGTLGNLSSLRTLSLRHNALSNPLPSDLAGCSQLRLLFLNGNRFSGEIPPFLSSLPALIRINLANNYFSGEIPLSFNNLRNLSHLYLENNRLTGEIPDLDIPKLKHFNVSFNRLNGSVPEKLGGMPANSFLGMSLCGGPLGSCPGKPAGSSKLSGGAIAGIAVGAVALFLIIIVALFLLCRRKGEAGAVRLSHRDVVKMPEVELGKKTTPEVSSKQLVFLNTGPGVFNLEDLLRASAEVMGKGTFGTVYKAALEMDLVMAVKRLRDVSMPEKEFVKKIEAIGAIEHPNLVPLRAYYYSREEKLLVYDFMPHGSLFSLLHAGNKGHDLTHLKWETRISIALDAARGIEHIHSTSPSASHGNVKSSNILLAGSYEEARVSDHGLYHIIVPDGSANFKDFAGYSAPEFIETQRTTHKADVFSFGVVLLELVTGKAPSEGMLDEGGVDLPRWVRSVIHEESAGELFDAKLMKNQSPEEEVVRLLQVGLDCTALNPERRPAMSAVVARIEEIHHLAARRMDRQQEERDLIDDVN